MLYGRLPGYHLSDRGQEMARVVAAALKEQQRDVTAVVSSPLQRAQETAAPTAAAFGLQVTTDERLLEAGNDFEGSTIGSNPRQLLNPRYWAMLRNPFRPSWGEPYWEQADRVLAAAAAARDANLGHEVVLVSHQLPIWVARRAAEGKRLWHNPKNRQCTLCSLTSLHYDDDELVGVEYSEPAGHLAQSLSKGAWSVR